MIFIYCYYYYDYYYYYYCYYYYYYYYYYYQRISRPNNWRDFIETMKDKFLIDYDYVFCQKTTVASAAVFEPLTDWKFL